MAAVVAVIVW